MIIALIASAEKDFCIYPLYSCYNRSDHKTFSMITAIRDTNR